MENNTPNKPSTPVSTPVPQQAPAVNNPTPATVPPKLPSKLNNLKDKFSQLPPQQKRLMIVGGVALGIAFLSLILAGILKSYRPTAPVYVPTPSPTTSTPFPQSSLERPSVYATDSAVLKLEESINERSKSIDGMDTEESQLRPPDINFKVDFGN